MCRLLTWFSSWSGLMLGLIADPKLEIPQLILGKKTTITCTAPGRYCPGSDPKFTWIWPGVDEKDYVMASEGRTSTLTFTPSSKHHYTDVICKVTLTGNIATEQPWTLTVKRKYHTSCTLLLHIYILPCKTFFHKRYMSHMVRSLGWMVIEYYNLPVLLYCIDMMTLCHYSANLCSNHCI